MVVRLEIFYRFTQSLDPLRSRRSARSSASMRPAMPSRRTASLRRKPPLPCMSRTSNSTTALHVSTIHVDLRSAGKKRANPYTQLASSSRQRQPAHCACLVDERRPLVTLTPILRHCSRKHRLSVVWVSSPTHASPTSQRCRSPPCRARLRAAWTIAAVLRAAARGALEARSIVWAR